MTLTGKHALVTGGGSGIGRATALLFARLGATVVLCGRTLEKLEAVADFIRARGGTVMCQSVNVREPEQVDALYAAIHQQFGRLDYVVNNAGGQFPQSAIDYAPKGWMAVINNNLEEQTRRVLKTLTPREEKVLRMRFGIGGKSDHTLEEVGQDFNVTRERIRQIEAKALRKLRHPSRSKQLESFVDF